MNDYGRAVWAAEIASKALLFSRWSDERLGETSSFLGKPDRLPWWIRPGIKTRNLYVVNDPGSKDSIERWITMQQELNSAFFLDRDQRVMFYGSYGYRPMPESFKDRPGDKPEEWISREHYFRVMVNDVFHMYAGLMDKVFGIKNVDHKAFAREMTQLTRDDQSHGVMAHLIGEKMEFFAQYFMGNLQQKERLRPQGFTLHFDRALGERGAFGGSYLNEQNDFVKRQMISANFRSGLRGQGNGFLSEVGMIEEKPDGQKTEQGIYTFFENMIRFTRGYHGLLRFETWKADINSNSPEAFKYGFGFLTFPWVRTEF